MPTRKRPPQTPPTTPTPDAPAPRVPSSIVFGRVLRPDGPPLPNTEVQAWHRNLRTELQLGTAHTDARGFYDIHYDPPKGLSSADLLVRAVSLETDREIGHSPLFCHAHRVQLVDVIVGDAPYRGYSEFERLTRALEPHLDGASLASLTAKDVDFLACTARQDPIRLTHIAAAYRDEARTNIPAAAFYALFRQGLPTSVPSLLSQPSRVLRRALEEAIAENIVPVSLTTDVDATLHHLKQAAVVLALDVPDDQQSTSLSALLGTTGLPVDAQTTMLTHYALHQGTIEEYWMALKADPGVGPEKVAELQFTLQLGTLAGGYVPMVELLQTKAKAGKIESIEKFVALTEKEWLALVKQSGVPPTIPGDTPAERTKHYVTALRSSLERAFPTPTIVEGLRRQRNKDDEELLTFFGNSAGFAFAANVDRYLVDNAGTALDGIADVPALVRRLKGMQRLYRLAPDVDRLEAMTALSSARVSSAHDIVRLGREPFLRSLSPTLGGASAADAIFARAEQTTAVALTVFGQYGRPLIGTTPAVMSGAGITTTTSVTVPSWETLFGSLSSCTCEHCRSVYSPSAYLVDLLEYVRRQSAVVVHADGTTTTPSVTDPDGTVRWKTALDVLFERRADIGDIELSCANADTELAYIDLVNETLERAVAREAATHQTTWTADELRANAEHLSDAAYEELAQQVYPRELPFNLWLLEARSYLGHLGVSLHELMDVLQRRGLTPSKQPVLELAIAIEQLTLSQQAANIVVGTPSAGRGPEDYWGVRTANWPAALFDLPNFLRKGELSYADLTDLLSARFINPDGSIAVAFATLCTTEGATIQNLTETALDRMHRFLRLQKALGWTTQELDGAISAMAASDLTKELLVQLAQIRRLSEQLDMTVVESLSWWSAISTVMSGESGDETSFYDDLFLNNAVLSPADAAFQLDATRTELVDAGGETIGDHSAAILAALTITDAELSLVLDHAALTGDDGLTLDNLSTLHRTVSLARALDLSVADFRSVCGLTGVDPSLSPHAALDLTARAQAIQESGFSVAELDYLLRHVYEETSGLAPNDSAVILVLDGIGTALAAVATENAFVSDPTGAFTQSRLALLLEADDAQTAMAIVAGTSTDSRADQGAFLDEHCSAFLDVADAKQQLLGAAAIADPQLRYEYVLRPLLTYLVTILRTERTVQLLADALGLEVGVAEALLTRHVPTPTTSPRPAIEPFLEIAQGTAEYGDEVLDSYRLLHKIATVLTRIEAKAEELPWLFEEGPRLGWLKMTELPLVAVTDPALVAPPFDGWQRLVALYTLRDRYSAGDATIFSVLDLTRTGDTREAVLGELATLTGWSYDDLDFLTGADGFALTYPAHYRDERYLVRLQAAVDVLQRLGLSAAQVAGWRTTGGLGETRDVSRDIKSTVKAKYTNDTWLTIAEPIKSTLRELQRSALTAHLIATHDGFTDTNDLYAHYLIDVMMGACMKTSRIKQAHSSVQLFVQRSLMNLEPNVAISEAGAAEWRWMKLYRVWEANRKVFLYPESYIEPELRDDKSPFFEELENELLQNEVTDGTAETALVNYLLKLGEVATLDVRAVVHEQTEGASPRDLLHVVARTHNAPHDHYYRTQVDASYWTPWERVDVDIQGELLLAVVWNGRLHLMWPLFRDLGRPDIACGDSLSERIAAEFPSLSTDNPIYWPYFTAWLDETQEPLMIEILGSGTPDLEDSIVLIKDMMVFFMLGESAEEFEAVDQIVAEWSACVPGAVPEPIAWEVQLAWSEYRDGRWTAKRVTDGMLRTAFYPKRRFLFKPSIARTGLLDTSPVPHGPTSPTGPTARMAPPAGGRSQSGQAISQIETSQLAVQLDSTGELIVTCFGAETLLGSFRFTGCGGQVVVTAYKDGAITPSNLFDDSVSLDNMRIVEDPDVDVPLTLVSGQVDSHGDWSETSALRYVTALGRTPGRFNLAIPHQYNQFVAQDDFFYQDETRSFHVSPGVAPLGPGITALQDPNLASFDVAMQPSWSNGLIHLPRAGGAATATREFKGRDGAPGARLATGGVPPLGQTGDLFDEVYRFHDFSHPHACTLLEEVGASGTAGIMRRSIQAMSSSYFESTYAPVESVVPPPYPLRNVDFAYEAAYSGYNWESFFHAPLLIASRLSQNQRFEEAQRWYHYIFDPTTRIDSAGVTGPERYWVFNPFYLESVPQDLPALMEALNAGDPAMEAQVAQWRAQPFNPHLIARLRPGAYQKSVVMKYLDNLIAWGDALFRQDTIETLNEATQLYILAADILGPRPEPLPATKVEGAETYNTLAERLDDFSNALVEIENVLPAPAAPIGGRLAMPSGPIDVEIHLPPQPPPLPTPEMLYFCIPDNEDLLSYWSTVADRLFKIRNCMNIEGIVRQLPLYEPPIDPALLVRAAAAGVDLSSALSDLYAPRPAYRFQVMLQRAIDFCGDVRSLGAALLSALEKQSAEELALLHAGHEVDTLDALRSVRERQVEEGAKGVEGVEKSRAVVDGRRLYYATLLNDDLSANEKAQLKLLEDANRIGLNAQREELLATVLYALPQVTLSIPPEVEAGGINFGQAAQAVARWHGTTAVQKAYEANRASLDGGYDRRRQEWQFQLDSGELELAQLDTQLAAASVRLAIAENELTNHDAQVERARAVRDVMTARFTNGELYGWMVSQLSALYSQSYQLAYDLAKRAEKAYEHELGIVDPGFIQFGYWDSLKKGLLGGERLHNDLRRMDASYLENDTREYELSKHVSLAMIDPVALVKLRREGICYIQLPEALFDLDCPGAHMRRFKAVSLTIPSVAGPFAGINCKLTLESSSVRVSVAASSSTTGAGYLRKAPLDADERFRDELGVSQSMIVSVGQNDHGLFDVNLNDLRYLPFERRGVISAWKLELTNALPAFDYESISDVVIGLRYTARDGGETLKQACLDDIMDALSDLTTGSGAAGLTQAFSVRHEFADAWYRFLNTATAGAGSQTLELPMDESYFPYRFQGSDIRISAVSLYLLPQQDADPPLTRISLNLSLAGGGNASADLAPASQPAGSHAYRGYLFADNVAFAGQPDAVSLTTSDALSEQTVENLILVFNYEISPT